MREQYFIQQFARRTLEKIPNLPDENYVWSKDFLCGFTDREFYDGVCTFNNIMTDILKDVMVNPQSWGIPCCETQEIFCTAPVTPEESKTVKGLLRIGNMFHALGIYGNMVNQSLCIDKEAFKKYKITKGNLILKKLQEFGFVLENYWERSSSFLLGYPDNDSVLQVIKAYTLISDVKAPEIPALIMRGEWRFFGSEKGGNFQFDWEDFCRGLFNSDVELAKAIFSLLTNNGYTVRISDSGGLLQLEPKHKKDKKRLLYLKRERDNLSYNFRFDNINKYISDLEYVTDEIRNEIIRCFKDHGCVQCGRAKCPGSVTLRYRDEKYERCILIGGVRLISIPKENAASILRLLESEIQSRLSIEN